jgi:glycosyltransferase involved in cell wall biosynthesis
MSIALVRGAFLNQYEMQTFGPLAKRYDLTAFSSLRPLHVQFPFPVVKLPSPMDLPEVPFKMPILNRMFIDAHYLVGLEKRLRGFDLVHTAETYYHYTQQALAAKRRGHVKKVIATVLENIPNNNEGIWGRRGFKARARKELDHVVALSRLTRDALLKEGMDAAKITVIGFGIDTKRFTPVSRRAGNRPLTILFCGRLEEYKGIFDLLDATRMLAADPSTRKHIGKVMFVGEGTQKERLVSQANTWGLEKLVRFESHSYDEMPRVYTGADIFVAPSKEQKDKRGNVIWREQYGMVLLEAQAAGLPIVTTRSGAIAENVGDAALLVLPSSPKALAKAIRGFVLDAQMRKAYGAQARKRAQTVHDARAVAARIAQVYERVMVQ